MYDESARSLVGSRVRDRDHGAGPRNVLRVSKEERTEGRKPEAMTVKLTRQVRSEKPRKKDTSVTSSVNMQHCASLMVLCPNARFSLGL